MIFLFNQLNEIPSLTRTQALSLIHPELLCVRLDCLEPDVSARVVPYLPRQKCFHARNFLSFFFSVTVY